MSSVFVADLEALVNGAESLPNHRLDQTNSLWFDRYRLSHLDSTEPSFCERGGSFRSLEPPM